MTTWTPKTDAQIVERIAQVGDLFGTERGDLIFALSSFEAARPFLRDDATPERWEKSRMANTEEAIKASILDYLPFAWDKANNCRGLSAARSLFHMRAWLWLLGEDEVAEVLGGEYDRYGKPQLAAISERYGFNWQAHDNGEWVNEEGGEHRGIRVAELPWRAGP